MKALICGISGQDGSYLANFLLSKTYQVWGTSRNCENTKFENLTYLGIKEKVKLISMVSNDFGSVFNALKNIAPDEIYFLSGQSSVGLSFDQPSETIQSFTLGILNVLEAIRVLQIPVKLYHASSSECFGDIGLSAADENTRFHPLSPYAIAKASAHWLVVNYRNAYGIYCCNGILFNHESPFRPIRFVTKKIRSSANRIARGSSEKLNLERVDIARDWGWAPEYVEAMWIMLQQSKPDDFVIATGITRPLKDFISIAFSYFGLNWQEHIIVNPSLSRPSDLIWSQANPDKARIILQWESTVDLETTIKNMCDAEK